MKQCFIKRKIQWSRPIIGLLGHVLTQEKKWKIRLWPRHERKWNNLAAVLRGGEYEWWLEWLALVGGKWGLIITISRCCLLCFVRVLTTLYFHSSASLLELGSLSIKRKLRMPKRQSSRKKRPYNPCCLDYPGPRIVRGMVQRGISSCSPQRSLAAVKLAQAGQNTIGLSAAGASPKVLPSHLLDRQTGGSENKLPRRSGKEGKSKNQAMKIKQIFNFQFCMAVEKRRKICRCLP